ncbi:hypothetical protein MMC30_002973 [Trapelia coarctata]|nr:hypothetical protein [Trapelia coarctata]
MARPDSSSRPPRPDSQISPLPTVTRLITTHTAIGHSTLHPASGPTPWDTLSSFTGFNLIHSTHSLPLSFNNDADQKAHEEFAAQTPVPLVNKAGSICRIVDLGPAPPGVEPFMHRTESLDYGIVISGEVELILEGEDGKRESRIVRQGDVVVQRGTMHAWRVLGDEWCRMCFVMIASEPVQVGDRVLEEDLSAPGMPPGGEGMEKQ